MANSYVPLSQLSPYQIKSQELDRRAKLADLLTSQAYTAPEAGSYNGMQAPISPIQGITKVLQAGLGGYQTKKIEDERKTAYDDAQTTRRQDLANAVQGSSAQSWVNPDTGEKSAAPAGGSAGLLAALMQSKDPELAQMGLKSKLDQDQTAASQNFTLGRDAIQNNYRTAADTLSRVHQEFMADKSEANQANLQKAQQDFTAAQGDAQRQFQATQQTGQQAFQAQQQKGQQEFTGGQNDQNRALELQKFNAKPLTDEQAKAAGFADRMVEAGGLIDKFGNAGTGTWDTLKSAVPGIGNRLVSNEFQQLDQAKRNFVNALLRRESGAAISSDEFDNANKQYFPQPGDSKETIAQKANNRKTSLDAMARSAGSTYKIQGAAPAAGTPAAPNVMHFDAQGNQIP